MHRSLDAPAEAIELCQLHRDIPSRYHSSIGTQLCYEGGSELFHHDILDVLLLFFEAHAVVILRFENPPSLSITEASNNNQKLLLYLFHMKKVVTSSLGVNVRGASTVVS